MQMQVSCDFNTTHRNYSHNWIEKDLNGRFRNICTKCLLPWTLKTSHDPMRSLYPADFPYKMDESWADRLSGNHFPYASLSLCLTYLYIINIEMTSGSV